jgi:hypothetical protein
MKKIISVIFVGMILLGLVGCGSKEAVTIEGYDWELTLIQTQEDGSIVGCATEYYEAHKEIEGLIVVDLTCSAENGSFTITDKTNEKAYTGTYTVNEKDVETIIYDVTTSSNEGMAVTSVTKDDNGGETPTLIIRFGDYALNFQASSSISTAGGVDVPNNIKVEEGV